ncbi:hypothetical protein N008_18400 [Hymenobacter sp. APR13]|nr:hypothetical protein N008_18400 [Hymenobacter sp. APR13]
MLTGTSVDTLDPEGTELTLLNLTVTVSIEQAFLNGVFSNGPNVFATAIIAFCQTHNLFPTVARGRVVDTSWHNQLFFGGRRRVNAASFISAGRLVEKMN